MVLVERKRPSKIVSGVRWLGNPACPDTKGEKSVANISHENLHIDEIPTKYLDRGIDTLRE